MRKNVLMIIVIHSTSSLKRDDADSCCCQLVNRESILHTRPYYIGLIQPKRLHHHHQSSLIQVTSFCLSVYYCSSLFSHSSTHHFLFAKHCVITQEFTSPPLLQDVAGKSIAFINGSPHNFFVKEEDITMRRK